MDFKTFQKRVMARTGEYPSEDLLNDALSGLAREAIAMRTLVSLDGDGEKITDENLIGLVGDLLLRVTVAAGALAVDLDQAMGWALRCAEARCEIALAADGRLVSARGQE